MTTADVLTALDCVWKTEVRSGKRSRKNLRLSIHEKSSPWARTLPVCSVTMRACSLFDKTDFDVLRAVIAQRPSNANRQEVLTQLQAWSEEAVEEDWRLVRRLARVFVLELLEQDQQSTRLLDEVLPETASAGATQNVLRGLWLDNIGRRDAAIELWLKSHDWSDSLREPAAALMLEWGLERHHDPATELAIEMLKPVRDRSSFYPQVAELLKRDRLDMAELLLGEFEPSMPMTVEPLAVLRQMNLASTLSQTQLSQLEQTDLLFELLRKNSQAGRDQAAERAASRALLAANHGSDDDFITGQLTLMARIEKGFVDRSTLRKFLESQCANIEQSLTVSSELSRASLCALRIAAHQHHADLVLPLLQKFGATSQIELSNRKWASDPALCLCLAQSCVDLDQLEPAAVLMARSCQLRSNWLEEYVLRRRADRKLVAMIAGNSTSSITLVQASVSTQWMCCWIV